MRGLIWLAACVNFLTTSLAHAGGELFAGGTRSAVIIYTENLDPVTHQLILDELAKQLALGKIRTYGVVTDPEGDPVTCAQFGALETFEASAAKMISIAQKSGARSHSVAAIGSCRFGNE